MECRSQVYARGLCSKHGGKKQCAVSGCVRSARLANLCYNHGARQLKKKCTFEGCSSHAQFRRLCVRHGGRRKCTVDGCNKFARYVGLCTEHGRVQTSPDQSLDVEMWKFLSSLFDAEQPPPLGDPILELKTAADFLLDERGFDRFRATGVLCKDSDQV
ncbi:hypothetical protein LEN26_000243 [Aphanomyces euteiches]|nr:hypothetical protein LEN26_000243 [Aphanomyces euteiches]